MEKPNEESQESSVNNWDGLYRSMKKFSKETQEGLKLSKEKSRLAKEEQEKRDNEIMAKAIRDSFCEIYQKDVLQDFANEMRQMLFNEKNLKKFPVSPVKGKLDLDLVRKSIFFCI